MVKKILICVLTLSFIFVFAACGQQPSEDKSENDEVNVDEGVSESTDGLKEFNLDDVVIISTVDGWVADDYYNSGGDDSVAYIVFYDKDKHKSVSASLIEDADYASEYKDFKSKQGKSDDVGEYKMIKTAVGDFYFCQLDNLNLWGYIEIDGKYLEITCYGMDEYELTPADMATFEKYLEAIKLAK